MTAASHAVHHERGDLAVEYVILVPVLFLLLAVVYVFGRVSEVNATMDSGTRDAARIASESSDYDAALRQAKATVVEALGANAEQCDRSLNVDIGPRSNFLPGHMVTVSASCDYSIGDVLPGAPGSVTETSSFTSIIDPNRTFMLRPVAP